jgi:hypothetical protein
MKELITRVPSNSDALLQHLKSSRSKVIIFGADIAGKIVAEILKRSDIQPDFFVDNNKNKCGIDINGTPVLHATALQSEDRNAVILIASTYISDIVMQIEELGFYQWVPISNLLEAHWNLGLGNILQGDLRKNHSGGEFTRDFDEFVLANMINSQKKYLDPNSLYIRSIDLIITEKCSLKCKDCSNLMQYYDAPVNLEDEELLQDLEDICSVADEINEIRIIGGDPFVKKDFHHVVAKAASYHNVNKVVVYTNGTICPPDEKLLAIANSKTFVFITTYGDLSRNANKLEERLIALGINYNKQPAYGWTDCADVEEKKRTEAQLLNTFKFCCAKHFTTLTAGRIFRCPFSANVERLKAIPESPEDYVDIHQVANAPLDIKLAIKNKLRTFLREITFINACNYCNGRTYGDPEIVPGKQTKEVIAYVKFDRKQTVKKSVHA